ncbi:MAG: DHH family phosphoesterase [Candidatus Methanomethylicia archaeon]|jgi:nanoRNase/pAp phosphatase (c-di-AMP/oligoRNAs hydrolase)|nr:DHH family phosphoesterase [Candidatus Methanomethylicia archaeon]
MSELLKILNPFRNITIVCHPNADVDSLGSAYAIYNLIKNFLNNKNITIYTPESINSSSIPLIDYLNMITHFEFSSPDIFILIDTSSLDQIPLVKSYIEEKSIPYIIIDHHIPDERTTSKAILSIVREATSTCEIVYEIIKDYISDKKILEALLAGIVYDSRRFLINPKKSISLAYELINRGADIEKILQLLSLEQNFSEKMAKIKGCSRMRVFRVSSWIITFTYVSAFEASVARALIDIGADLAFVINESEKRLTGRVREIFYSQTGLNLVTDIIRPLIEKFSGQGGGHPTAASVNFNILTEDLISEVLELIANKLKIQKNLICEVDTKK